jgi:hypothetical protein
MRPGLTVAIGCYQGNPRDSHVLEDEFEQSFRQIGRTQERTYHVSYTLSRKKSRLGTLE